jgi:VanZ family protein
VHSVQNFRSRATAAWTFFVLWVITITILSSLPGKNFGPSPFFEADKIAHMLLFATGGALLAGALRLITVWSLLKTLTIALGIMALIGVADEIHQLWTPGRSGADAGDWTADVIGAAIGIACVCLLYARRTAKANLPASGTDRSA